MVEPKYKRVVLKLSGEALSGEKGFGLDENTIVNISEEIKNFKRQVWKCQQLQEAAIFGEEEVQKRWIGQHLIIWGCQVIVINALALQDALEKINVITRVQSAIEMRQIAEPYIRRKAIRHLEKRKSSDICSWIG